MYILGASSHGKIVHTVYICTIVIDQKVASSGLPGTPATGAFDMGVDKQKC